MGLKQTNSSEILLIPFRLFLDFLITLYIYYLFYFTSGTSYNNFLSFMWVCALVLLQRGRNFHHTEVGMGPGNVLFSIQFLKSNASLAFKAMITNSDYYLTLLLLVTCPKDLYDFEINSQVLHLNFCTICNAIYHTTSVGIQNEIYSKHS